MKPIYCYETNRNPANHSEMLEVIEIKIPADSEKEAERLLIELIGGRMARSCYLAEIRNCEV